MGVDEEILKSDLYNIDTYEWGGDQNNSLDKHLVSRFVKVISKYNDLQNKQTEIQANAWNYVRTSWYNNWTSYLIESIFKHHSKVISAVGEIKSVDFFINDIPVDLKVTFFPNQYMNDKLKAKLNGKSELTWLKQKARENGIELSRSESVAIISEKISAAGREDILLELRNKRKDVITDAQNNKNELMTWLYANQGEMRFGAENRLFLVLVDSSDMSQSWKMKRAFEQIESAINSYLNTFTNESLKKIDFSFKGKEYSSWADVIFVVK
jgi:urease gamma subunit